MADSTSDLAIYCKESVVRGHHVFKRIWTPVVGEVLTVAREAGNTEDRFAVAVTKDDMVVGHVPCEFSKLCWHFLRHGGTIACEVTGRRKRSSIEGEGLVVPCLYTFKASEKFIVRLREVMEKKHLEKKAR